MKNFKLIFFLLCLLISGGVYSQAPTKQWDFRFGGGGSEELFSVQQTADGGYILGGYSFSGISGDRTQASQGGFDYWLVKTDASGLSNGTPALAEAMMTNCIRSSKQLTVGIS